MKKVLLIFVLMTMTAWLVACGGEDTAIDYAVQTSDTTPVVQATATPTPTPEPTPEPEILQSALVGRWRSSTDNITFEFFSDWSGIQSYREESDEFIWSTENGRIIIVAVDFDEAFVWDYAISGDGTTLTLFDDELGTIAFTRLGSSPMSHAPSQAPEQSPTPIPETTPTPTPQPATAPTTARINIQELLGADFDTHRHLFGNVVDTWGWFDEDIHFVYRFDSGIIVENQYNMSGLSVAFSDASSLTHFHFDGIDGTSTRQDVISILGEPTSRWSAEGSDYITYVYNNDYFGVGSRDLWREVFFTFDANYRITSIYTGIAFF